MVEEPKRPAALLGETLPTLTAAQEFVGRLVARLGERAVTRRGNRGRNWMVFVRAAAGGPFLLPWPVVTLVVIDVPEELERAQDESDRKAREQSRTGAWPRDEEGRPLPMSFAPRYPVPAMFRLFDGGLAMSLEYRRNGALKGSGEPEEKDAFTDLVPILSRPHEERLDALVTHVASMDLGRHGPARVFLPRPIAGGPDSVWSVARRAIREAMAARKTPPGSFWVAADGYSGTAIAFGKSRDEALAAWRKEVERVRPAPPPPRREPAGEDDAASFEKPEWNPDEPPETIRLEIGKAWDTPPFDPSPDAVPGAILRVAAIPPAMPPHGTWSRWIGDRGATGFAAGLPIEGGYTLVGESLFPLVDLRTLDQTLDAIDQAHRLRGDGLLRFESDPLHTHSIVWYRLIDAGSGLPIDPRAESSAVTSGFDAGGFDGLLLRTHVVRVRELG